MIVLSFPHNLFSQDFINLLNKDVKIYSRNTKFNNRYYLFPNKYLTIKVNGKIVKDSIKFEVVNNFVNTNYDVKILNDQKKEVTMKNFGRSSRESFKKIDIPSKEEIDADISAYIKQKLSYQKSLVKHTKKFIEIKVPIRKKSSLWGSTSYDGYGLEKGKYYITVFYTNEGLTHFSDTIPLFVK